MILLPLSFLFLLLGRRILKSNSVRYKDEKLEVNQGAPVLVSRQLVLIGGALGGMVLGYGITGSLIYAVVGLSGGFLAVRWLKEKQESDRMELLRSQYPDVLSQLESATQGNLNLYQALEDITPNLPRPARDVFYDTLRLIRTGDNLADALEKTIAKTGWKDLNGLLVGFRLSGSMGIDFAGICKYALEAYYEKESARGQIRSAIAQNMMTMRLLSVLPFFVVGIARATSPSFTEPLFTTLGGNVFFVVCVLMIICGNVVTKRMVNNTLNV